MTMASSIPKPGDQTYSGAELMDWQTEQEVPRSIIMAYTIQMPPKEAMILLKVGLQQEFNKQFQLDLTMQADDQGVHVLIPYEIHKSVKDKVSNYIDGFRRYVLTNCMKLPFKELPFRIKLSEVLQLQAVSRKLLSVLGNSGAHLEIDTENEMFLIYSIYEDMHSCNKNIEDTVVEGIIDISDIRDELNQDARWCQFQEALKKETYDRDFVVKIQGHGILMAGLHDSVSKVYEHLKGITDSLRNVCDSQKLDNADDYQTSFESQSTDYSAYEVDFPVESYEVFSYLQAFQLPMFSENVLVKPYEEKLGFELIGPSKDTEDAEVLLKSMVKQIKEKTFKFEDGGYFTTPDGERFLKDNIQGGCRVLCDMSKEGHVKDNDGRKSQKSLSPTFGDSNGHRIWRWTVQQKCHIILAESKADEMSADVALNIKETKSPGSKLDIQTKQSHQIFSVEVPIFRPGPTLETLNERLRDVYQKLSQDKLQSVAVSIDNIGSWKIEGFVPRVVRSFSAFLLEKGKQVVLAMLLCSTDTDSLHKAKDIIQQILKEEFEKQKSCRKVPAEQIQIQVVKGLLDKTEADILVNTTAPDLNLANGAVSQSLLKTAGREMQEEIYKNYTKDIELGPGEIAVTKGYKLKCNHVIHGVLEGFEEKQPDNVYQEIIRKFMTDCLVEAVGLKCRTIAFPAVGTGRLQYPIDIVASEMFWAVHMFGKEYQNTTLKEVQFVLYPEDKEAIKVFKEKEKEISEEIKKQQLSVGGSQAVFRFIGPKENIERAKQHIEDRLEILQGKQDQCIEEIHGISYISYELLKYYHSEALLDRNKEGFVFSWKDSVLKITGHQKNISVVKAEINSLLNDHVSELAKTKVDVQDMYEDEIDSFLARNSSVCKVYLPGEKAMVICGSDKNVIETEEKVLDTFRSDLARNSEQNQPRNVKEESSKLIKVEDVAEDIYLAMCEKYTDMGHFVITYNPGKQTAMVFKQCIKQFEKRLQKIKRMQRDTLVIQDDKKHFVFNQTVEAHHANDVVCVYQPEQSSVTVFGTDQKLIKEEIHKLKLKAGMIEATNRANREFTESLQAPESPDLDDSWTLVSSVSDTEHDWHTNPSYEKTGIQTGGARPKDHFGPAPVGKADSSSETFITNEGIPVYVYKQDILKVNVDCIVNAANDTLKHGGGIARVISKGAGFSLDKECSDHIKTYGRLRTGKVFVSNAGKLWFKCVIHAVGPCWSDYKPHTPDKVDQCKKDLQDAVFNSLVAAEKRELCSIAIPAISSAIYAVPEEICTSMYAKGVIAYSKQARPSTRLKEIHFIDSFSHIVGKIQQRFREMLRPTSQLDQRSSQTSNNKPRQTSLDNIRDHHRRETNPPPTGFPYFEEIAYDAGFKQELHCHFSPLLHLIVDQGSVFEKARKVDGIVCSDKKEGQGKGFIAKTLMEKGGQKYKVAAEKAFKHVQYGDVVVVKEAAAGFKKVFLAVPWQKDPTITEIQREYRFRYIFKAVFKKVVAENCKTIVMPLMFTGEGKVKPGFCTERLLETCMEFSKEAKSKLTVYLINSEEWKTDIIVQMTKDFVDLQKTITLSSRDQFVPQRPTSPKPTGRSIPKVDSKTDQSVQKPSNNKPTGRSGPKVNSKTDQSVLKPANNKPTGRSGPKRGGKTEGHLKSGQDFSRSQFSQQRPRGDTRTDKGAMSSSFTFRGSGSSGSNSKFYGDDSKGMKNSDRSEDHASKTDKDTAAVRDSADENCVICMDRMNKPKKLKCGHIFCTDCIDSYFTSYKKVCPTCGVVCGVLKGDQPPGNMDVRFDKNFHCAGFDRVGTHVITYSFNSGTQGQDHPNPGRPYKGITRTAFLPDTREGREVLKMLEVAFDRKLVFTIGSSRTTGQEGVITWNDIHHKTNPKPNTPFGYPDDGYLDRVKDELAVKGVTPEDIPAS